MYFIVNKIGQYNRVDSGNEISRPLELTFKAKCLFLKRLEFMTIDYVQNKDLEKQIRTFIDSPQHLVTEG